MGKAIRQKKLRIELHLDEIIAKSFVKHVCKEGEPRKLGMERVITNTTIKAAKLQRSLL